MISTVVRAGAGAGKTTELVQRVLSMAQKFQSRHGRFPRLVVTTFTRKATQELRERLMDAALKLQEADPSSKLVEFVQRPSALHISTIHGVLSLFLARYGSKIGLSPKFAFIDQRQEEKALKRVVRDALSDPEDARALELLLEQVDLRKILKSLRAYMEVRFEQNAPLTAATTKDSLEIIRRQDLQWIRLAEDFMEQVSGAEKLEAWENYLSLLKTATLQLRQYHEAGLDSSARIEILRQFCDNRGRPSLKNSEESVKDLREEIQEYAKGKGKWADSEEGWELHGVLSTAFEKLAESVFSRIVAQKLSAATLTMQDLELFSLKLVNESPESAQHFATEWDFWLIDEYQDTSPRQVFLLKHLMGESHSFTVGDPQQSIYLFRGARSEVFAQKEEENSKAGGQSMQKMENYRSRPELLHFFNYFFARLGTQFRPMIPAKESVQAQLPAATFISCPLPEKKSEAEKLQEDDEEMGASSEHQAVISRCLALLKAGVAPEQICVLSRTNRELDLMAQLAGRLGIAIQVHASSKFYSRREVKDALALMKFLVNPNDNLNLLELLRSPWFFVSDTELVKHCQSYSENFWPQIKTKLVGLESIQQLVQLQQLTLQKGLGQVWVDALLSCGLFLTAKSVESSGRREANLWKLINTLKSEEKRPGFSYLEFSERAESSVQDLESGSDGDATPVEEPQRVNLMTVHASKGLQFEHVILPAMGKIRSARRSEFFTFDEERKIFCLSVIDPEAGKAEQNLVAIDAAQRLKQREFEEYDRLLYVALTRAKTAVTLIWSKVQNLSWAQRMWRPQETGLQTQENFVTEYLVDAPVNLEPLTQNQNAARTVPQPLSKKSVRQPGPISVTRLLEAEINQETHSHAFTVSKERSEERVQKALRGVQTHRLFESLKYREESPSEEIAKTQEFQFVQTWNQGQLLHWIRSGEVEWGFCATLDTEWIQGQIDLWAQEENGDLVIIDYKTGSTKYSEKAFEQLEIYAWALRKMKKALPEAKIKLVVVYPFEEKVIERLARPDKEIQDDLRRQLLEMNRNGSIL